ncbi:MAG: RNA polymerase sigma factor [Phycisphaerae bacterium]|nr:RNA polymerase sigma factor [Phycisphaerae bacterium]
MNPERLQIETLWHTCAVRVRRFLRRSMGDHETADDLLGQTFLEAARSWHRFTGRGNREAWLFGIARNLSRRAHRSGRLRRTEPLTHEPPARPETESEDLSDELGRMRAAIARLPDKLRETLTYRLADGMSYDEIAAALGIPVGTVRSRLHDAVRRLREQLTDEEQE